MSSVDGATGVLTQSWRRRCNERGSKLGTRRYRFFSSLPRGGITVKAGMGSNFKGGGWSSLWAEEVRGVGGLGIGDGGDWVRDEEEAGAGLWSSAHAEAWALP